MRKIYPKIRVIAKFSGIIRTPSLKTNVNIVPLSPASLFPMSVDCCAVSCRGPNISTILFWSLTRLRSAWAANFFASANFSFKNSSLAFPVQTISIVEITPTTRLATNPQLARPLSQFANDSDSCIQIRTLPRPQRFKNTQAVARESHFIKPRRFCSKMADENANRIPRMPAIQPCGI